MKQHDIIVIGAGHAGVEAAWAAARMGRDVAICTLSMDTVAHMPCNPAIGGTAKGHLVREIDALGGLMGLRDRRDRRSSSSCSTAAAARRSGRRARRPTSASTAPGCATRSSASRTSPGSSAGPAGSSSSTAASSGLALEDGDVYRCDALVVTTGTFLNGLVHVGRDQRPAGRAGEPPSRDLAESLKSFGFSWGRLKTGTPPRLHRRSIDFSRFAEERGDDPPVPFSFLSGAIDRAADRLSPGPHDRARPRARARAHRAIAALQRPDRRHRPALLPVARRQGDAVSRTASGTRSSSSRKGSTRTRST